MFKYGLDPFFSVCLNMDLTPFFQFGGGVVITQGVNQDREFLDIVTGNAKLNNKTVTLSGHSAGGRRNFTNILSSNYNQYLNDKGQSILNLQFVGSPTNFNRAQAIARYTGANLVNSYNNSGDFVGNVLGNNGGNSQILWSTVNIPSLFELPIRPNFNYSEDVKDYKEGLTSEKPARFENLSSPHSNYYCHPGICNFNKSNSLSLNVSAD